MTYGKYVDRSNVDWMQREAIFDPYPHPLPRRRASRFKVVFGILCVLAVVTGALIAATSWVK